MYSIHGQSPGKSSKIRKFWGRIDDGKRKINLETETEVLRVIMLITQ